MLMLNAMKLRRNPGNILNIVIEHGGYKEGEDNHFKQRKIQ